MYFQCANRCYQWLVDWLVHESAVDDMYLSDFDRLSYEIRPCDVLLVEGRSRVSAVIKNVTQSSWTHSALYIGRLHDIDDPRLRAAIKRYYPAEPEEQLLIEALLGQGTVVTPLKSYEQEHLRICRPQRIERQDAQKVVSYVTQCLGSGYNIRQLIDLARLLFPYALLPRKGRSSLFNYHASFSTRTVCSTMIAEAFMSVHYPILPIQKLHKDGRIQMFQRNPRLFAPKDFDYSPYFDIIKYPFYGTDVAMYKQIDWNPNILCDDPNHCYIPPVVTAEKKSAV